MKGGKMNTAPLGTELFNELEIALGMTAIKDWTITVHKLGNCYNATARWETINILDEEWINISISVTNEDAQSFGRRAWRIRTKLQYMLQEIYEKWGYYQ